MSTNAKRYLELISQHLQEHHAALFVGSGFSLNADKVTSDVPDIPLWAGLAQKFKEKLGDSDQNDPLALAESVEIAYGRSELDHHLCMKNFCGCLGTMFLQRIMIRFLNVLGKIL